MRVTLDELLEIACKADQAIRLHQGVRPFPEDARNAYYDLENAMSAAKWLEDGGLTEVEQIGPFGRLDIKRGDKVKIKAGSIIRTTHPKYDFYKNPKIARRSYTVNVHDVSEGWIANGWWPHRRTHPETHREQQITWAGEGGYWCWLYTKDIELVN